MNRPEANNALSLPMLVGMVDARELAVEAIKRSATEKRRPRFQRR